MVYNITLWKQYNYSVQLSEWVKLHSQKHIFGTGSQPPFNLVFYKNYKQLSSAFNLMYLCCSTKTTEPNHVRTVPELSMKKAVIVHWNGWYKPWMCKGPYSTLWVHFFPDYTEYYSFQNETTSARKKCAALGVFK